MLLKDGNDRVQEIRQLIKYFYLKNITLDLPTLVGLQRWRCDYIPEILVYSNV